MVFFGSGGFTIGRPSRFCEGDHGANVTVRIPATDSLLTFFFLLSIVVRHPGATVTPNRRYRDIGITFGDATTVLPGSWVRRLRTSRIALG